jgi:hypothetical protein
VWYQLRVEETESGTALLQPLVVDEGDDSREDGGGAAGAAHELLASLVDDLHTL